MNQKPFALLLVAALFAGCAAPKRTISIDSTPPGAKVFFAVGANEDFAKSAKQYIGTTPCTWTTELNGDGSFKMPGVLVYSMFVPPVAVFYAEPPSTSTNLFPQHQVFHGGTMATPSSKAPEALLFDLTKP